MASMARLVRRTQYASAEHQALLVKNGLVGSMSRRGNCWDNAVMERLLLNLKVEQVSTRNMPNPLMQRTILLAT
jgi:putative transposase